MDLIVIVITLFAVLLNTEMSRHFDKIHGSFSYG